MRSFAAVCICILDPESLGPAVGFGVLDVEGTDPAVQRRFRVADYVLADFEFADAPRLADEIQDSGRARSSGRSW